MFPTRQEIDNFIHSFEQRYGWYDRAIISLLTSFPKNDTYEAVLNKVVVINRLYSTSIFDVDGMARKILHFNIDTRLSEGDLTLVDEIATPDKHFSSNKNYNYSFATKYCNWHNTIDFPIFDSVVKRLISALNREYKFSTVKVKEYWDYNSWKQIIDELTDVLEIMDLRYKKADKFFWAWGNQFNETANKRL